MLHFNMYSGKQEFGNAADEFEAEEEELDEAMIDPCPSQTIRELELELQGIKASNRRRKHELDVFQGWLHEDKLEREKVLALEKSIGGVIEVASEQPKTDGSSKQQTMRASSLSRR